MNVEIQTQITAEIAIKAMEAAFFFGIIVD